jgi:hypothetical protein
MLQHVVVDRDDDCPGCNVHFDLTDLAVVAGDASCARALPIAVDTPFQAVEQLVYHPRRRPTVALALDQRVEDLVQEARPTPEPKVRGLSAGGDSQERTRL